MAAFGRLFGLGILPALAGMALQLDIEPVGIGAGEAQHQRLGLAGLPGLQQPPDGAVGAAGQADEALGMGFKFVRRDMGKRAVAPQVEAGIELHQMRVARRVLRQQHHRRGRAGAFAGLGGIVVERELAADDGLHSGAQGGDREFQRREHVVGVGDGDGGHRHLLAKRRQLLQPHRAFEKRVFGVNAKVDESGSACHPTGVAQRGRLGKPPAPGFVRPRRAGSARGRRSRQPPARRRSSPGRQGRPSPASSPSAR